MEQSLSWEANWFCSYSRNSLHFRTRKFITILTSAHHLSLSWANSIQSPQPPPTSWRSILKEPYFTFSFHQLLPEVLITWHALDLECLKRVKDQNLLKWITALPTVSSYYKAPGHHSKLWLKTLRPTGLFSHSDVLYFWSTDNNCLNTFAASYLNTQGLNNSCLKSPAST